MNKKNSSSSETIRTTDTERRKGKACGRLVINILKLFRICRKPKKKREKRTG